MPKCSQGHDSDEVDFCSECGISISTTSPLPIDSEISVATSSLSDIKCPDCGTPKTDRFCENCRYDFLTSTSHAATAVVEVPSVGEGGLKFDLQVIVDVTLINDPAIVPPTNLATLSYPLDLVENLIGRRAIENRPDIQIADGGVSKRHLKLIRQSDMTYSVLELGSTNGTLLNGQPLPDGILTPLTTSDELILGSWTRLRLVKRGT